jgi:hypothetical protein
MLVPSEFFFRLGTQLHTPQPCIWICSPECCTGFPVVLMYPSSLATCNRDRQRYCSLICITAACTYSSLFQAMDFPDFYQWTVRDRNVQSGSSDLFLRTFKHKRPLPLPSLRSGPHCILLNPLISWAIVYRNQVHRNIGSGCSWRYFMWLSFTTGSRSLINLIELSFL